MDLRWDEFIHTFGDAHIYSNHMDAIHTQLSRDSYLPPQLKINTDKSILILIMKI